MIMILAKRGKRKKEKKGKKLVGKSPGPFVTRDTELYPPNKLMARHVRSDEMFSQP